jgi:hypothetical protein
MVPSAVTSTSTRPSADRTITSTALTALSNSARITSMRR